MRMVQADLEALLVARTAIESASAPIRELMRRSFETDSLRDGLRATSGNRDLLAAAAAHADAAAATLSPVAERGVSGDAARAVNTLTGSSWRTLDGMFGAEFPSETGDIMRYQLTKQLEARIGMVEFSIVTAARQAVDDLRAAGAG